MAQLTHKKHKDSSSSSPLSQVRGICFGSLICVSWCCIFYWPYLATHLLSSPFLSFPFLSFPFLLLQHPYYPSGIGIGHSRPSTRVSGSLDGQFYFIFEVSSVFSSTQPSLHLGGSNPDWPRKSHLLFFYKITPSHPSFTLAQPSPKSNKYLNQERYFSWVRA